METYDFAEKKTIMLSFNQTRESDARIAIYAGNDKKHISIYLLGEIDSDHVINNRGNLDEYIKPDWMRQQGGRPFAADVCQAVIMYVRQGRHIEPHNTDPRVYEAYCAVMKMLNQTL